jgi:GNAT superfamily N-acetyltransferase
MPNLHDYGPLLLGSRLRKLSEALFAGVDEVYESHGVTLPSKCFPILFLLRDHGRLGISELARLLGQSHAAVSQMSRKLLAHRVVREWPDKTDERRRLLGLSTDGTRLMKRLEPVWAQIVSAVQVLDGYQELSDALTAMDHALQQRGFGHRIRVAGNRNKVIEIIPFERRYAKDFKRLNLEWVERYFRVEPVDEAVLSHPERIIKNGGAIFLARAGREIIGTCALISEDDGHYELSKMSVTDGYQGLGVGRRLLTATIDAFEVIGAGTLFLETNSILTPAITLYESAGFAHAPPPTKSPYARADVYMIYRGKPKKP